MEITVERKYKKPKYIIGNMLVDGRWYCNTLEPPEGTATETVTCGSRKAIATGTYKVKMQWSPKFGKMLPCLQDVPGRSSILIHAGNYPRDTVGCILVGMNTKVGMVLNSRDCLARLLNKIQLAINSGEAVTITIR